MSTVGDIWSAFRVDFSKARKDVEAGASQAGDQASQTFGQRFKAGLTRGNFGKGILAGLGLGVGFGVVGAVAKGVQTLTDAIGGSVDAAIEWESALAGVSKTLDTTGLSAEEAEKALQDIGQGLRDMAKEIPIPVERLAALAEAGGALGIAREDLLSFTRQAAILGTTTDLAAEDAATALGKINAVLPLTRDQYSRFAATLVDLGNKGSSTESEIVSMAQNMAGAAGLLDLGHDQLLGWAAALANVGENAEAGGSSFQRFALGINDAVSRSTPKLRDIAEVAGMTADEFAQLWGTDASEALRRVVEGLGRMEQGSRQAALAALGFRDIRITRALLALTNNTRNLNQALAVGAEAWDDNSAAAIEAEKRFGTTESKLALLNNQLHDFAVDAGGALVDLGLFLSDLLNAVRKGIDPVGAAIGEVREQVRLLARERGLDEAAAVAAYDAERKRLQLTEENRRALELIVVDLQSMHFRDIAQQQDELLNRVDLTTEEIEEQRKALDELKNTRIDELVDTLRDLAVEAGKPLTEALIRARVRMQELNVTADNGSVLIGLVREDLGLLGPAAEEAAERTAEALAFIDELARRQGVEQRFGKGGMVEQMFGAGFARGIEDALADAARAAAGDPELIAAWTELGIGFAFDLTGGFRKGVEGSQPELRDSVRSLRAALDFDWGAEAAYVLGREFGRQVGRGLRSGVPELETEAQNLALAGLQALDHEGRRGPRAADRIGRLLGGLYASGMERSKVEARLAGAKINLGALEEIAAKAGWHTAGEGVAGRWVKGVRDKRDEGKTAARTNNQQARTAAGDTTGWYDAGYGVASAWVAGFAAALERGDLLDEALWTVDRRTSGESPPPEGPLKDIDKGGFNVGRAWRDGFLGGLGISRDDLTGALGGLAGLGLAPMSLAASLTGSLGPVDVGPAVVRHEHHISADGARNLRDAGFDTDRLAEVLREAARASGRRYSVGGA